MRPRQFVFDTTHTMLVGEGKVDFSNESFDMRLVAKPRGKSLVSLRGPINVKGTFSHPSVMPDMKRLSARAAAAAALGVIATPFAALVPFMQFGANQDVQCGPLTQSAKQAIQQPVQVARH